MSRRKGLVGAVQRTLEDEEEQERERRRRNRTQSSTTEEGTPRSHPYSDQKTSDRLSSVEESQALRLSPPPSTAKEREGVQTIVRSWKERRQKQPAVEYIKIQSSSLPEKAKLELWRGHLRPSQANSEPLEPLKAEKEAEEPHRHEQRGPWAKERVRPVSRQSGAEQGVSQKTPSSGKTLSLEKALIPEKTVPVKRLVSEETFTSRKAPERTSISEMIVVSEKQSTSENSPTPGKMGALGRCPVSEKVHLFEKWQVSEKTPAQETNPVFKLLRQCLDQWQSAPEEQGQRPSLQKKQSSLAEKPASQFLPITQQISPKKETAEVALSRSARMRLPVTASTFDEKLEKYQAALQRADSLKSSRMEFFVTPSSVATRRHIFETEQLGKERAEQASSLKENLKLSGVVTSKLNLWISRTRESGERPPGGAGRASRHQEGPVGSKEAGSTLDAEVRRACQGRPGPSQPSCPHPPAASMTPFAPAPLLFPRELKILERLSQHLSSPASGVDKTLEGCDYSHS